MQYDPSDLAPQFTEYLHNGTRLIVRNRTTGYTRRGTVGKTTGWKPAYILMHRRTDTGSWDVLSTEDEIVGTVPTRNRKGS